MRVFESVHAREANLPNSISSERLTWIQRRCTGAPYFLEIPHPVPRLEAVCM